MLSLESQILLSVMRAVMESPDDNSGALSVLNDKLGVGWLRELASTRCHEERVDMLRRRMWKAGCQDLDLSMADSLCNLMTFEGAY